MNMPLSKGRHFGALVLIALTLGTGACSRSVDEADTTGPELVVPAEPRPGIRGNISALRALQSGPEYASDKLIESCMSAAGWTYVPLTQETFTPEPLPASYEDERATATSSGYIVTPPVISDSVPVVNEGRGQLTDAENERYEEALNGPLDGYIEVPDPVVGGTVGMAGSGCRAQAIVQIFGSVEQYLTASSLRGNLHLQAFQAARNSAEMTDLSSAWADCMQGKDIPVIPSALVTDLPSGEVSTPEDAITVALKEGSSALGPDEERRLAQADIACEEETNYINTRTRLEDRYLTAYADLFSGQLAATQELYSAAQSKASRALN